MGPCQLKIVPNLQVVSGDLQLMPVLEIVLYGILLRGGPSPLQTPSPKSPGIFQASAGNPIWKSLVFQEDLQVPLGG